MKVKMLLPEVQTGASMASNQTPMPTPKPLDWTEFGVWCMRPPKLQTLSECQRCLPMEMCAGCVMRRLRLLGLGKGWTEHHPHSLDAATQFMAGAFGGGTATYCTHWLDTLKVKMQTFPDMYPNATHCLRDTLKHEGFRGLYQGAAPAMLGSAAKAALVFTLYGLSEDLVMTIVKAPTANDLTLRHHASAGAITGVVTSIVLCPLELIKCRRQAERQLTSKSSTSPAGSSWQMTRSIMKADGLRGLYRGLTSMWAKDIPGSFVYFGSYECAKSVLMRLEHTQRLGTAEVFMCGMAAGMCYGVMHPVDAIKTRVQVMSAVKGKNTHGFIKPLMHILKTEGLAPLYSGLKPSMLRACVYSGIQFVTFENIKSMLMKHLHRDE